LFVRLVGIAFFDRPMALNIAPTGFGTWLVVVLILSTLASLLPAIRAASISVREALAYE
jgi:ABC-type lipoprotein release transport system permease subunit